MTQTVFPLGRRSLFIEINILVGLIFPSEQTRAEKFILDMMQDDHINKCYQSTRMKVLCRCVDHSWTNKAL